MAVRPIVRLGHPTLRTPAAPLEPSILTRSELADLIRDMGETMRDAEGVGLAAPQLGISLQLFVYVTDPADEEAMPLAVINPMVEPEPGELVYDWEGCLSIPGLRGLVPRHPAVRVRGHDGNGERLDFVAAGFAARVIQHEYDHLNGVLFLDRMRDLRSLAFEEEWSRYLVEPAED